MEEDFLPTVYQDLMSDGGASFRARAFDIRSAYQEESGAARFVTAVFSGGNYIPRSVRSALAHDHVGSGQDTVEMKLVIDEQHFQVLLYYRLPLPEMTLLDLTRAFRDFLEVAQEWRWMLDEYGQQDLVYAHVSS